VVDLEADPVVVSSWPRALVRLEGAALAALAVWVFADSGESWWLFAALILAPDLGLLGYLVDPAVGARTYNLTHTLLGPAALIGVALAVGSTTWFAVAMIWVAHIGVDRLAGYGLKYPTGNRDTHLQRL
jgi:hypothetical protein